METARIRPVVRGARRVTEDTPISREGWAVIKSTWRLSGLTSSPHHTQLCPAGSYYGKYWLPRTYHIYFCGIYHHIVYLHNVRVGNGSLTRYKNHSPWKIDSSSYKVLQYGQWNKIKNTKTKWTSHRLKTLRNYLCYVEIFQHPLLNEYLSSGT